MKLLTALLLGLSMAGVASAQPAPTRPPQAMQASITWLYYKDLPIRGFTAFDPEGYTLEFETFRDHPQNAKMRALLRK